MSFFVVVVVLGGGEATALSVRGFGAFAWKDVMNKKYAVMESF